MRTKRVKKKTKSTVERFFEDKEQKEIFDKEHKEFLLSELIIALMEEDNVSVRKLAEVANVSPTIIQELRSGKKNNPTLATFASIADALGYTLALKKKGKDDKVVPLFPARKGVLHKHIRTSKRPN